MAEEGEEKFYQDQAALISIIVRHQGIPVGERCNEHPPAGEPLDRAYISWVRRQSEYINM